ncbi:phosphatase PAP2 family protein [Streptomyces sp. NPDC005899]|uniref:phosphatase PAP2 family protein n=1 Tax=Streptomyces sp. NPDC005899 TaxID=3155716 RepID=UPI0033CA5E4F
MHSPPHFPPRSSHTGSLLLRAGVVCATLSALLTALVAAGCWPLMLLDSTVANSLHREAVGEPGLVHVNRVLTDWVWDPLAMRALTAVVVITLWWRGAGLLAVWVAATSALATLLQQGLKAAVGRERPQWPDPVDSAHYAAFPSGHAMTAMVTFGLLLWLLRLYGAAPLLWWTALVVAVVSVAGVAFTRLYLGVHWLTDVLAGLLLGAAVTAFSAAWYRARWAGGAAAPL